MSIEDIKTTVQNLTDEEWGEFLGWVVSDEKPRRAAQPAVEQAKQEAESETSTRIAQQLAEEHPEIVEKPTVQADGEVREWEPWHPLKASTHYRYGDRTRHHGKIWRDVLDPTGDTLNVWEPGAAGIDECYWVEDEAETVETPEAEEETPDEPETSETEETPENEKNPETAEQPAAPAYRQPSGGHDAYKQGDRVTYNGAVYESTINGNVWAPDAYPQGWRKL